MGVVPGHSDTRGDASRRGLRTTKAPALRGGGLRRSCRSDRANVARLQALLACGDGVLHLLAVGEGLEPVAADGAVVDEHVRRAVLRRDEAEALRLVEPFDSALSHEIPSVARAPH